MTTIDYSNRYTKHHRGFTAQSSYGISTYTTAAGETYTLTTHLTTTQDENLFTYLVNRLRTWLK